MKKPGAYAPGFFVRVAVVREDGADSLPSGYSSRSMSPIFVSAFHSQTLP